MYYCIPPEIDIFNDSVIPIKIPTTNFCFFEVLSAAQEEDFDGLKFKMLFGSQDWVGDCSDISILDDGGKHRSNISKERMLKI